TSTAVENSSKTITATFATPTSSPVTSTTSPTSTTASPTSTTTTSAATTSTNDEVDELKKLCLHLQYIMDQQLKEREKLQQHNEQLQQQLQQQQQQSLQQQQQPQKQQQQKQHRKNNQNQHRNDSNSCVEDGICAKHLTEIKNLRRELEACKLVNENLEMKYSKDVSNVTNNFQSKIDQLKDSLREKEIATARCGTINSDIHKLTKLLEVKDVELASIKREFDNMKDQSTSRDVQLKFLQQKLRQEQDALK
ncbi:hypothetical protein HELRODRAFT_184576, partial [Helobdella robusta]|uniref:Uncharacterized protein n=1 Tax=Helobdella robusta TaxID=6412 RepID=T1FLI4_HELRO